MKLYDTRHGRMMVPDNDMVIGRSLSMYGEWAWSEINFLLDYATSLIVDAGANLGTHSLSLSKRAEGVISFEPQRQIFQTLCGNIALNDIRHIQTHQLALGDTPGLVHIQSTDLDTPDNYGSAKIMETGQVVQQITLDALNLPECGLIKMDLEGYELKALKGAEQTIKTHKPFLYMEAHEDREAIFELLHSWGYKWEIHSAPAFNPENYYENPIDGFNGYTEENLFCWSK